MTIWSRFPASANRHRVALDLERRRVPALRQRLTRMLGGVAVLALVAGGAAACKSDEDATAGKVCDLKIGFFGALTGDAAGLGLHMRNGVKLAIEQYNKDHADCKVVLAEYDSQGDPAKAPALATSAVADAKVVGIVGPAFSGETEATLDTFKAAGLPIITPSATRPSLSDKDWGVFHRGVGND